MVWFGEALDSGTLAAAVQATACDVFLTIGTSSIVYPAAGLVDEARNRGAFPAEINVEETPASSTVDLAIHGPAEELLLVVNELVNAEGRTEPEHVPSTENPEE